MKYAFVKVYRQQYTVRALCRTLGISRSGYYHWLSREPSKRQQTDNHLTEKIHCIHRKSHETYGTLRVWQQLKSESIACGRDRVARLRREAGLQTRRRKRFKITTFSRYTPGIAPNLLARQFNVDAPNKAWVGDVTFIPTREGWLYLATMIDLHSRKVVGWSMSDRNNVALACSALEMAIETRKPKPGLIHHTDRGNLYTSYKYQKILKVHGMIPSMSRKGDCYDNAVAESFFASLKIEWIFYKDYRTRREAKSDIFKYIEIFYNRQRLHQTLGYQAPEQYELNAA